ncbi:MAG: type IV pilus twitching motility protein PilT [Armatimonadetes bacterium]|nr:type IV pilus twitching motility protein PilT [Armatimonadota bacterium]MDW8120987.1 type IV pilus twitching motility protein PilT [Armatimonadota bacterium]
MVQTLSLEDILRLGTQRNCSDVHLKAGSPPLYRLYGELYRANVPPLTDEDTRRLVYSILTPEQREKFEQKREIDFAFTIPGLARFRANALMQRGTVSAIFRIIPQRIPTFEELGLPPVVKAFCERPRGIVLVTGPAGCGKTTTLAAMVDYINTHYPLHIITIEDPIEFVHQDKMALVNQREVGRDTLSFANALKYALREDPDVILIGELRDLETISLAVTAAETGHLVLGTLHTADTIQTIDRMIDSFPTHQQQQIRMQLAISLVGVLAQRLVRRADGKGMLAVFEVLVGTTAARALIREAKTYQLHSVIQTGVRQGMITLEQSLANLVASNTITMDEALAAANKPDHLEELVRRGKASV